jgi:hypothetical protein
LNFCVALQHISRMNIANSLKAALATMGFLAAMDASALAPPIYEPSPTTTEAFDRYVQSRESDDNEGLANKKSFLWIDHLPEQERTQTYALLKDGQTFVRRSPACESRDCGSIRGGLIHDWVGIVFVPGLSLEQTLTTLQNYDRDADYSGPR